MSGKTAVLENEARNELISRINEHIPVYSGSYNPLLENEFGITDGKEFQSLPISRLIEISDFLDNLFV